MHIKKVPLSDGIVSSDTSIVALVWLAKPSELIIQCGGGYSGGQVLGSIVGNQMNGDPDRSEQSTLS